MRWKRGTIEGSVALASGKLPPTDTVESTPLTEITAVPGLGALALPPPEEELLPPELELGVAPPPPPLPAGDDDEPPEPAVDGALSLHCCGKGALVAERVEAGRRPAAAKGTRGGGGEAPGGGRGGRRPVPPPRRCGAR